MLLGFPNQAVVMSKDYFSQDQENCWCPPGAVRRTEVGVRANHLRPESNTDLVTLNKIIDCVCLTTLDPSPWRRLDFPMPF